MAHLVEPVAMRDQLYDFLSNHSTLTDVGEWSKSFLDIVPDENEMAGRTFPVAAVLWTPEFNALETTPHYVGGTDRIDLILWVCINTTDASSDQTASDEAVRLANLVKLALRSSAGRNLTYGGNTAAYNVRTPEIRLRISRKNLEETAWLASAYVRVEVQNDRAMNA